ncbi:hypothetical protein RIF29_21614 [Crotalaria pallida]|uniref:Uncharacterized protein n=1 Tax=Crotalaria pallida TaxID=3830 RepID=A0AAN9F7S1_CROPI
MKGKARKSKAVAKSKQNSSKPETIKKVVPNKTSDGSAKLQKTKKADMSKPVTSLVGVAIRTRSKNKSSMQESVVIPVPVGSSGNNDSQVPKVQAKKHGQIDGKKESDSTKLKRLHGTKERTFEFIEDLNHPPPPSPPMLPSPPCVFGLSSESGLKFGNLPSQREIGSSSAGNTTFGSSVWLSLVASENVEVGATLPQISTPFLRVKNGNLPVSFIESYVIKKLGLPSGVEVEIQLWDKPIFSCLKLQDIVNFWLRTMPKNELIHATEGSSAEDFVMVLSYRLKA